MNTVHVKFYLSSYRFIIGRTFLQIAESVTVFDMIMNFFILQ